MARGQSYIDQAPAKMHLVQALCAIGVLSIAQLVAAQVLVMILRQTVVRWAHHYSIAGQLLVAYLRP